MGKGGILITINDSFSLVNQNDFVNRLTHFVSKGKTVFRDSLLSIKHFISLQLTKVFGLVCISARQGSVKKC